MDKKQQQQRSLLFNYVHRIRTRAVELYDTICELTRLLNGQEPAEGSPQQLKPPEGQQTPQFHTSPDVQTEIEHTLKMGSEFLTIKGQEVRQDFEQIKRILTDFPALNDENDGDLGSDVAFILDQWDKIDWCWPSMDTEGHTLPRTELLYQLEEVKEDIIKLSVRAEMLAVPYMVNNQLNDMRTGEILNFYDEYSEEFLKPEFLDIAWQYLCTHPRRINGLLVGHGLIYRASASVVTRFLSAITINAMAVSGVLIILLLYYLKLFSMFPNLSLPPLNTLLWGYIAVMAGGLVNILVEVLKQYRTHGDHAAAMLANWLLWIHIKEKFILGGILMLWVGYCILVFTQQTQDLAIAFFVGYSIDSFIDLFLLRFTGAISNRIESVASGMSQQPLPQSVESKVLQKMQKTRPSE